MKINWKKLIQSAKDESGVTAIEYGLIAALVGVAIIGGAELLGDSLDGMFTNISTEIDTAAEGIGADAGAGEEAEGEGEPG
jgi:pilus assembly protein Flp/PilA